ncbi:unnamed protein product [Caenorhabditis angaria]|uniref:Uncharacterized protein n=1 Tax=Caenorhabditis angaria TaxID=860376 RepID=A0A9P1I3N5_9PELO|nr:unnamed protein product [Caenorhabditis angaria]
MFGKIFVPFILLFLGNTETRLIKQDCKSGNCYHIFRLSDRPAEEKNTTTMVKVVKNTEHGQNYYEIQIANGTDLTPEQYREVLQQLPRNAEQEFSKTVVDDKIILRPEPKHDEAKKPETQNVKTKPQVQQSNHHFPIILVALLLCIGIVLGILCTGLFLFIAHIKNQPTFDRTNVVTYRKIEITRSSGTGSRREEQNIQLLRRDNSIQNSNILRQQNNHTPTTVSQASTNRMASRNNGFRQISL